MLKVIAIARTMKILWDLRTKHNFIIQETDDEVLDFVMNMVLVSPLSNTEIAYEVLEMHMLDLRELRAA